MDGALTDRKVSGIGSLAPACAARGSRGNEARKVILIFMMTLPASCAQGVRGPDYADPDRIWPYKWGTRAA